MKLNWNFLGGVGVQNIKPSVGGSMDIFWNYAFQRNVVSKPTQMIHGLSLNELTDNATCYQFKKKRKENLQVSYFLSSESPDLMAIISLTS